VSDQDKMSLGTRFVSSSEEDTLTYWLTWIARILTLPAEINGIQSAGKQIAGN